MLSHYAMLEREQRKKQELLEKERIRRLMVSGWALIGMVCLNGVWELRGVELRD